MGLRSKACLAAWGVAKRKVERLSQNASIAWTTPGICEEGGIDIKTLCMCAKAKLQYAADEARVQNSCTISKVLDDIHDVATYII